MFDKSSIRLWKKLRFGTFNILVVISLSVKPQPSSAIFDDFWNVKGILLHYFHKNILPEVANEHATSRRCFSEKGVAISEGKIPEEHLWRNSFFSKLAFTVIFPGFWPPIYLATFMDTYPFLQLLPAYGIDPKKGVSNEKVDKQTG